MQVTLKPFLLTLFLTGCLFGPDPKQPEIDLPQKWSNADGIAEQSQADKIIIDWWKEFKDPKLTELIEGAIAANLDLAKARSRIIEARGERGIVVGDLFPQVALKGQFNRGQASENVVMEPDVPLLTHRYDAGFDALWELDLFGRTHREIQAASAEVAQAENQSRGVLLTVIGDVARNYVELRATQRELEVTNETVTVQAKTVALTRDRFQVGLGNQLDVARAEAELATTQAAIPTLQVREQQLAHVLSILLARQPSALVTDLATSSTWLIEPPHVPVGLPSELLKRRPDIMVAEKALEAQTARIGVALTDFFPHVTLGSGIGWAASNSGDLTRSGSQVWSVTPGINWPIFSGGKVFSNVKIQREREKQALYSYQQIVLDALREVEDTLIAVDKEHERREMLKRSVDANRRTVALAHQLYEQGLVDFLNVAQSETALFLAQASLVRSDTQVFTGIVTLYKALGGGWQLEMPEPEMIEVSKG